MFTRSKRDGHTDTRTNWRTEPQQRNNIPSATRCAGIKNFIHGHNFWDIKDRVFMYTWHAHSTNTTISSDTKQQLPCDIDLTNVFFIEIWTAIFQAVYFFYFRSPKDGCHSDDTGRFVLFLLQREENFCVIYLDSLLIKAVSATKAIRRITG